MNAQMLRAWSPFLAAAAVAAALAVHHLSIPRPAPPWPAGATIPDLTARLRGRGMEVGAVYVADAGAIDGGAGTLVSLADTSDGTRGQVYVEADGHAHPDKRSGDPVLRVSPFTFWGDPEVAARVKAALAP